MTRNPGKRDALLSVGADDVVNMSSSDETAALANSVDFLLSTIPTPFDMKPYVSLMAHDGVLVTVGLLEPCLPEAIDFVEVSMKRLSIAGSLIGSIADTQEVLDFCAEHGTAAKIETISADAVNEAFDRVVEGDVEFRFVIDAATLPTP